jgi:predicted nuclease with TOPRIM domain
MSDDYNYYVPTFEVKDIDYCLSNGRVSKKLTEKVLKQKNEKLEQLEQENAYLLRCLDGKPDHWSNIIYDKNKELEKLEQENARLKERLKEDEKINRYLRSSLNKLYGEISNGEHLDKEWIKEALLDEPRCRLVNALNHKIKQLEQENAKLKDRLKEAENVIEFYADTNNWQSPEDQGFQVDAYSEGLADMIDNDDDIGFGGKRAREYLEKWGSDE